MAKRLRGRQTTLRRNFTVKLKVIGILGLAILGMCFSDKICVGGDVEPDVQMDVRVGQKTVNGFFEIRGHYYISGKQYRLDMAEMGTDGGYKVTKYQIFDERNKLVYTVVPAEKLYFVNSIVEPNPWQKDRLLKEKKRPKVGQETVSGIRCDIYEIVDKKEGQITRIWVSEKVARFPIKVIQKRADEVTFTLELSNIKFETVDRAVFKIPEEYKKKYLDLDGVKRNIVK